jgi:type IV secretory pathway TrbL component
MGEKTEEVRQLLEKMDGLFVGFFNWLADQYDQKSGGFYYALSSWTIESLGPDIESTAQALHIIGRSSCGRS